VTLLCDDGDGADGGGETSTLSLRDELDRLEAAMSGSEPDDVTRVTVAARLRQLLAQWTTTTTVASTPASVGAPAAARTLQTASTDEVFAFIDNELGRLRDR
jgi:hypothetical protein